MGGILSAEVALLGLHPTTGDSNKCHRILGTINFDTPFLGMHPGVVASGIGSLFRSMPDSPGAATKSTDSGSASQMPMPMPTNDDTPLASPPWPTLDTECPNSSNTLLPTESSSVSRQPLSPFLSPPNDPNYNPPFPNDVRMATRSGWANALHFINKHSDGLVNATKSYVTSYFEFGGCMADYNGLKTRYSRLRALEDVDDRRDDSQRRIRFINYYTASTGRPKKQQPPSRLKSPDEARPEPNDAPSDDCEGRPLEQRMEDVSFDTPETRSCSTSIRSSIEEHRDGEVVPKIPKTSDRVSSALPRNPVSEDQFVSDTGLAMSTMVPAPVSEDKHGEFANEDEAQTTCKANLSFEDDTELNPGQLDRIPNVDPRQQAETQSLASIGLTGTRSLPPIPFQPKEPAPLDLSLYPEKDARKLAEKEHSRQLKHYQRAVRDRDKAIKDRRKLLEKREKNAKLSREKQLKKEGREFTKTKREDEKSVLKAVKPSKTEPEPEDAVEDQNSKVENPKRDKKFCMLPPKIGGEIDPCWVRVYMRGVDEVGAHCGLFFVGEHYEWLVNDVGARIKAWVEQE